MNTETRQDWPENLKYQFISENKNRAEMLKHKTCFSEFYMEMILKFVHLRDSIIV